MAMFMKAIRIGATLAVVMALGGFVSQAQAQFPRQISPSFRLPLNGTLNGAGVTPFGGISLGVGAGGGLLPFRNFGVGGVNGFNGVGLLGSPNVVLTTPAYLPSALPGYSQPAYSQPG